jgi:hypothetical protein
VSHPANLIGRARVRSGQDVFWRERHDLPTLGLAAALAAGLTLLAPTAARLRPAATAWRTATRTTSSAGAAVPLRHDLPAGDRLLRRRRAALPLRRQPEREPRHPQRRHLRIQPERPPRNRSIGPVGPRVRETVGGRAPGRAERSARAGRRTVVR